VRRGARRIVWLHAWGWLIATVLLAAIAAALVDFLLRPNDVVMRSLLSLAVVAVVIWGAKRWLWPAWRYRPSLLETSQRIELRWPKLGGRLSSSIEFLTQSENEATSGSVALRRRVIAEAEAVAADVDFAASLNTQPQRTGFAASAVVAGLLVVLIATSWQVVAIGAARLAMPWSALAWPRWNHLRFDDAPPQLARGDDLELVVIDEDQRLPESVMLHARYDDGETLLHEMKLLDGRMVHRLENVNRGFRYRAYGGDDETMSWQRLEVVEPLQVAELKIIVHPPEYAGSPWEASGSVFTTLEGSRLAIRGRADQPLVSARVKREGASEFVDLTIAADGLSFSLAADAAGAWQPKKSGAYTLQLTSVEEVKTDEAHRWDIRLTPDSPPTVAVASPSDGSYATPNALLPIAGTAKDDLAVAAVSLRFLRPGLSDEQAETVVLWKAKSNPLMASQKKGTVTGGQSHSIDGEWDLQTVFGIQPGDVLSWFVEAADFRPQTGQTTAARLTIISSEGMQERLVQRQASALSQLAEALNLQRETRTQVGTLEVQWTEVGQWRARDRDLLHSAELHQRQVQTLVGRSATGAATILAGILHDLQVNRLELPEMAARCQEILAVLDRLEADRLPAVAMQFAELLREARQETSGSGETKSYLTTLGREQEEIAETLETVLGKLAEWDSFQRIRRDLAQIRDDQRSLTASSQQLQAQIVSGGDVDSQRQADGRQLGRQQGELVRRFEKLIQRLGEFADHPETEQAPAQKAKQVVETAGKLAITARMRESARAADDLKLGQSLQTQQEVDRALGELLDALAGRLESDDDRAIQQLRDLAASLATLEREQGKLAEEFAKQPGDEELQRLEDEQRKLADQTGELAKKLDKNQASDAAGAAQDAAGSMKQAAEAAKGNQPAEASQQSRDAQKKLQEARRSVNDQIAQRQADLLREQMARLEQHINGLVVRQEAAQREAKRLLGLKKQQKDQLTEAQTTSVGDLSVEQEALAVEARTLGQGPQMPAAFSLQLQWTGDDMSTAASRLRDLKLDDATLAAQQSALDRLQLILEALRSASQAGNNNSEESPMGEESPMPPPADDAPPPDIHDLAEVKLLRGMQADINRRTMELESQRKPDGSLPPLVAEQLAQVAEEQGRVAELAMKLVQSLGRPKRSGSNNSAESPPDVSDEELLRKLDEVLLPDRAPSKSENKP